VTWAPRIFPIWTAKTPIPPGSVHDQSMPGAEPAEVAERLERRHPGGRDRRRLLEGERGGLPLDLESRDGDLLGERPAEACREDDLVPLPEAGDARVERLDDARRLAARDERLLREDEERELPLDDLPVGRVQGRRDDADDDLSGPRPWVEDLLHGSLARVAVLLVGESAHRTSRAPAPRAQDAGDRTGSGS